MWLRGFNWQKLLMVILAWLCKNSLVLEDYESEECAMAANLSTVSLEDLQPRENVSRFTSNYVIGNVICSHFNCALPRRSLRLFNAIHGNN
jgi:hypothetical protein